MINTVSALLDDRATQQGDQVAYFHLRDGIHPDSPLTYRQLAQRARHVAAELQARDLAGERVLLLYPAGPEFLVGFFGCLLAGAIGVPAPPPEANRQQRSSERLRTIIADCTAKLALCDESISLAGTSREVAALPLLNSRLFDGSQENQWRPSAVDPRAVAYLQYTSGSTSTPKGIEISHDNLLCHLAYLQATCRYTPESVTVSWMPNFHDWGLVEGLLEPLYNGTPCYIMAPFSFVRRPLNWLQALSTLRGTHTQGPSFAYEHCVRRFQPRVAEGLDLRSWRSAGIAAEPINFRVMQEFDRTFAPYGFSWTTFCPAFGLGEATLMASCCPPGEPPRALQLDPSELERNRAVDCSQAERARTVVSCGRLHRETIVRIVDPQTLAILGEREVGEIWIRDRAVGLGYWQRPEESRATFQAWTRDPAEGPFLRTGDLGFMADGELFVTGRWKELMIVRGSNHYPQDIEWTVQQLDSKFQGQTGAAFSVVVDDSERLIIVQEIESPRASPSELASLLRQLVERVVDQHEIEVYRVLLVERGTIPKTASGKIQRRTTRTMYLQGELQPLAIWSRPGATPYRSAEAQPESDVTGGTANDVRPDPPSSTADSQHRAAQIIAWLREFAGRRLNSQLMDQRRMVSPHVLLELGNHGVFGLQVPTRWGGQALRTTDMLRVIEQLGAIDLSLATLVFLSNTNGLRPILRFAGPEMQARLLPGLASGRHLAAFALSEPQAGSNLGAIETLAVRHASGGWRLNGTKRWNGSAWATWVTVIAREADPTGGRAGFSAFLVPTDRAGVQIGEEALTVGLRSIVQNSLSFSDVAVDDSELLGERGNGLRVANDALAVGRLCVGAVAAGAVKRALQLLDRYAVRRRIATGYLNEHPYTISVYQQTSLQLAALESMLRQSAEIADALAPDLEWLAMAIKVDSSEFLVQAAGKMVQLLGGRGFMENNEVGRIWRDAKALTIGEGPNESLLGFLGQAPQRARIAAWLVRAAGGELARNYAEATHDIFTISQGLAAWTTTQRDQWAQHWAGQVAIAATRHALLAQDPAATAVVVQWAADQQQAVRETALRAAQSGPGPLTTSELRSVVARFGESIGDVHPTLPGEDAALDPQLAPQSSTIANVEKTNAALRPVAEQAGSSSVPSRARLEQLLRARLNQS